MTLLFIKQIKLQWRKLSSLNWIENYFTYNNKLKLLIKPKLKTHSTHPSFSYPNFREFKTFSDNDATS